MSETIPQPQPENDFDPRMETLLETGQGNIFMAEAEAAGAYPEKPPVTAETADPGEFKHSLVAIAAKAEKTKRKRAAALPGVELGAVTGRDREGQIARESYEKALAEGRVGKPISKEAQESIKAAREAAHKQKLLGRMKNTEFLSLRVSHQESLMIIDEQRQAKK